MILRPICAYESSQSVSRATALATALVAKIFRPVGSEAACLIGANKSSRRPKMSPQIERTNVAAAEDGRAPAF